MAKKKPTTEDKRTKLEKAADEEASSAREKTGLEKGDFNEKRAAEIGSQPAIVEDDIVTRRGTSCGGSTKMSRSEYEKQIEKERDKKSD